ncbi:S-ribosylhomocysteine lyase [Anaerotignum lactatifermentans]|uniref:S-ribosylhomocysteine lyase n=1 Tax=Anaerotignum lactatifermentans TaxID=160404 RepID=A0ABS2G8R6_9FIRM|nr:S-ribosylhomocysteine lyase [Anaerotignum lactatifermentans]MBM6828449.1 S-ribosylhomocysteine lyase [Anaerotignum lactatifermentans]MBM6877856.1 S-ribosylhomocysteine lyase [Anaerotignum lactatifermentans]MBM6950032.1 S-ribosylhomocysteine lyase [Anaerotignum lactatifermentans]
MDVTSFGIDHNKLLRGIYVSRKDTIGSEIVTTFDVRMKEPNREMVMDTSVMHTIEHLMATFFRGHTEWAEKTIYVGPMGCRTGMYVIFKGDLESQDVKDIIRESYDFMANFSGEIPAAKPEMCGNYLDHNLEITKIECKKFLEEVLEQIKEENMVYPRQNEA